jgi:ArsR family transcriptional regulator, virulence genes transcriptional regulator
MQREQLHYSAREASVLLKAMSNEHRLLILYQLVAGEKSVGELVRQVGLSQSALSQHLARLRRDNLVRTRREAQTIFYSVAAEEPLAVLHLLDQIYGAEPAANGHYTRARLRAAAVAPA